MKPSNLLAAASVLLGACTINEEVRPLDMSAAAHESVARADDDAALTQERSYNPNADVEREHCAPIKDPAVGVAVMPCSARTTNTTQYHLVEARHLREAAAAHRTAGRELREAEASTCTGISEQDKNTSPFARRGDILSTVVRTEGKRVTGASILVRAIPGMSSDYLAQWVDCELSRNAAMGFPAKELDDPLNVKGAKAKVESYGEDFRVTVTAADESAATDIANRTNRLIH